MSKRAKRSVGVKFLVNDKVVGDLRSISSPSMTQEELDVTTLDSDGGYREFIGGFKDPGEVSLTGFFVPEDEGQAELYRVFDAGEQAEFEIEFPPSMETNWQFSGIVTAYNTPIDLEEAVGFEVTIRVSGKPTLTLPTPTPTP